MAELKRYPSGNDLDVNRRAMFVQAFLANSLTTATIGVADQVAKSRPGSRPGDADQLREGRTQRTTNGTTARNNLPMLLRLAVSVVTAAVCLPVCSARHN